MKGLASSLVTATDRYTRINRYGTAGFKTTVYKSGFNYKRAGILLMDIIPSYQQHCDFPAISQRSASLMKVLDEANQSFGSHTLFLRQKAAAQVSWTMRFDYGLPSLHDTLARTC